MSYPLVGFTLNTLKIKFNDVGCCSISEGRLIISTQTKAFALALGMLPEGVRQSLIGLSVANQPDLEGNAHIGKQNIETTYSIDLVIQSWQKLPNQPENSSNFVEHKKAEVLILQLIYKLLIYNKSLQSISYNIHYVKWMDYFH